MSATVLDGKALASQLQQKLQERVAQLVSSQQRPPGLAVILVGNDPASICYVNNKIKASKKLGLVSKFIHLEDTITQETLLEHINELNQNSSIDGVLVQLPLPAHIDKQRVVEHISPQKDVDGFHPYNIGRLLQRKPTFRPCTPAGIMGLLEQTGVSLKGLNATIVGASDIVGRPMLLELLMANCTVTLCHQYTQDLQKHLENADLVISATGQPHLIPGHWIKPKAIVIDVGMNRMDNGDFIGDVDFEGAKTRAGWITPVPGGVGPMTVTSLLSNTLQAYEQHLQHEE